MVGEDRMIQIPDALAKALEGQDALTFLLNVGAFLGVAWALWKLARNIWPGLNTFIRFVNALGKLPAFMSSAEERLTFIQGSLGEVRHEVLPHNGGSLRDGVDEVRARVEAIEAHEKKDLQRLAALEAEIRSRTAARIAAHPKTGELPEAHPFPNDTSEE